MLPQFYRFVVVNNAVSTITWTSGDDGRIKLSVDGWFITPSTGKIAYASIADKVESPDFDGAAETVVAGGEVIFDQIDNTANLYLGAQVQLEVTHDLGGTADGTFDIYLAGGNTTDDLPTDATGYGSAEDAGLTFVGSLVWDANGQDDEVMTSNVFNI